MGLLLSKRDNLKDSEFTKKHLEYPISISSYHQFLLIGDNILHKYYKPKHINRYSTYPRLYKDENC